MTGLLVLTLPYRQLCSILPQVLSNACSHVSNVLYVHLDTDMPQSGGHVPTMEQASKLIRTIYSRPCPAATIDVRVILAGFKGQSGIPVTTSYPVENVMVDTNLKENLDLFKIKYADFLNGKDPVMLLKDVHLQSFDEADANGSSSGESSCKIYKDIVAGGTFDHIHAGHKVLLSEGLLRCTNKFTIGMADGPLLAKKTLFELIQPVETRITTLRSLLTDIDPSVQYHLEAIYEPMGPSGTDPHMEMIIVSQETLKGGNYVNKTRAERKLSVLDVQVIDLIEDTDRTSDEEQKMSSSSTRMRSLGTLIKTPDFSYKSNEGPYIVGLTGCSASGKSNIAKKLESLGAAVIDCDKLGHQAYSKNTPCYNKLVAIYGPEILTDDKEINRRTLGSLVFGNETKLKQLNEVVWPEIVVLVKQALQQLHDRGVKVVVLDAAVLLEADWDKLCQEVWVCLLPRAEAVRRICGRDGCTEDQAQQRLSRQLTDAARLARAHVVLCSLWDYDCTARQVVGAWGRLQRRLGALPARR